MHHIGKFGKEAQDIMFSGTWDRTTLDDKLSMYPIRELRLISESLFIPSIDQKEELRGITDITERKDLRNEMYVEWVESKLTENEEIRNSNHKNEVKRKLLIELEDKMENVNVEIFTWMFSQMEYDSQRLIERYKSKINKCYLTDFNEDINDNEDESILTDDTSVMNDSNSIDFNMAKSEGNWIWLLKAVRDTHIKILQSSNAFEGRNRLREYENKLKNMKYKGGSFYKYLLDFEDLTDIVISLGSRLDDLDKIHYLMHSLPNDIFESLLSDFQNVRKNMDMFPNDYNRIVEIITTEYELMCINKPNITQKYIDRKTEKKEDIFNISEKKKNKGCYICGRKGHDTESCSYRNTYFTIEENKAFYERIHNKCKKEDYDETKYTTNTNEEIRSSETQTTEEQEPELVDPKIKASKGTITHKPSKVEESNHVYEVNNYDAENYQALPLGQRLYLIDKWDLESTDKITRSNHKGAATEKPIAPNIDVKRVQTKGC
jgi:hypothetical protein